MANWYETASADNGTATATRAAEADYQHTAVRVRDADWEYPSGGLDGR